MTTIAMAHAVWFGRLRMHELFDYSQPPSFEEAYVAKTFQWNKDVGWSFNDLKAGPLTESGTCPVARASATCAKCYAQAGNFQRSCVKRAQVRARMLVDDQLYVSRTVCGFMWLLKTATAARATRGIMPVNGVPSLVVREHSSGDYHSLEAINQDIALREALAEEWPKSAPPLVVWVPTRVWAIPKFLERLRILALPGGRVRWVVRPSALDEGPAPTVPGLSAGTGVGYEAGNQVCPKILNHSTCRAQGCTLCWEGEETISYPLHGQKKSAVAGEDVLANQQKLERMT